MKRILRWSAAFVVFAVLGAVAWYGYAAGMVRLHRRTTGSPEIGEGFR
ncbi:MAG: hypothetical protein H7A53_05370 [Akkermansiaceae bacterium]|nr:hypothetical protein [Akkermansiaceae bacterium]